MGLQAADQTKRAGSLIDDLLDPVKALESRVAQLEANEGYSQSRALIREQRASGTAPTPAGLTAATWVTRGLTTIVSDPDSITSLAANRFTLQAGIYVIKARSPGFNTNRHKIRLRNITDGTTDAVGSSQIVAGATGNDAVLTSGTLTLTGAKDFEIQHWSEVTVANGAGIATSSGELEIYTEVEIIRISS